MPNGAKRITNLTTLEIASARSSTMTLVLSLAFFNAKPKPKPQAKIPIKLPVITALKGLSTILNASVVNTSPSPCGGLALAPTISKVK